MSKQYYLTLQTGLANFVDEQAKQMGITALGYIQYLIMKAKEQNQKEK